MKSIKRWIGIVLVLILFVQTTSFTFALSSSEQEESIDFDVELEEVDDTEIIQEESSDLDTEIEEVNDSETKQESSPVPDRVVQRRIVDPGIMAEFLELQQQVQDFRKKEGNRALTQEEVDEIAIAEARAAGIETINQELQELIDTALQESSISNRSSSGSRGGSFSGGDGTKYDPYIITLPEEMEYISDDLSAYYSLDNNIDMSSISWVPTNSFTGQFNGNMHTISNLTVSESSTNNVALFGSSSGATIENLILHNAVIEGNNYVGGIVGLASNSTLRNLIIDSSSISGNAYVGGIVGACTGTTEIYECTNNGSVNTTGNYTGGIVGFMFGVRVDECVFEGEVNGIDYVGGIAGVLQGDSWECTNAGIIKGGISVGGIAGFFQVTAGNMYWLMFCLNSGDVTGNKEVAGIAGYSLSVGNGIINIQRSGNQGLITANDLAGGITGDSACNLYIQRPYNTGEIIAKYIQGGLAGRLNISTAYDGVLRYCYNAGKVGESVVTTQVAGMLIGRNYGQLVNNLYYILGPVPAVGLNQASGGLPIVTTAVSKIAMRTIHTTLGSPLIKDDNWINSGYPIIDGINYVFGENYRTTYPGITVSGTLKYNCYNDQTTPTPPAPTALTLNYHTVEIYYKDGTLLDTAITNDAGYFSATFETDIGFPNNENDIYISVAAKNDYANVTDWTFKKTRTYKSPEIANISIPVLDFSVINVSEGSQSFDLDAAFNILHWITSASNYYHKETGMRAPLIDVRNQRGYDESSYYWDFVSTFISIGDRLASSSPVVYEQDQYNCSVIVHEFGHHLMSSFASIPIGAVGDHYIDSMCTYPIIGGPNYNLAYSEGFANFFSSVVREKSTYENYNSDGTYFGIDIDSHEFFSTNANFTVNKDPVFEYNAAYEIFTAGAMWDLISISNYTAIDNVFTDTPYLQNLQGFYNQYMDNYGQNKEKQVWDVFHQNHVSFDMVLPTVSISKVSGSSTAYEVSFSDNVYVDRLEWFLNGTLQNNGSIAINKKEGTAIYNFSSIPLPYSIIEVRVYDSQGNSGLLPAWRVNEYAVGTYIV